MITSAESAQNPLPWTVSIVFETPTETTLGFTEDIVGTGLFTTRFNTLLSPPPGEGLVTFTGKYPPVVIISGVTFNVNWLELTYVAERHCPFRLTDAPETKSEPETTNVNDPLFASTLFG